MKLDELKKLADNCCSNYVTIDTKYIQQLIALIEMQHDALKELNDAREEKLMNGKTAKYKDIQPVAWGSCYEALAAFDKFNGGE